MMLSMKEVSEVLDVTTVTIHAWRKGSTETKPLGVRVETSDGGRRTVLIDADVLKQWVSENRPHLLEKL